MMKGQQSNLKVGDYLQYFQRDGDELYIRRDFIGRLKEMKGFSLKYLLGIIMGDDPREQMKLTKAFETGKPIRKVSSTYKKQPIPKHIRWAVWERDNFTCQECGSRRYLSVDHIHPEFKGGTLDINNLQTLCKSCNSRKGAR